MLGLVKSHLGKKTGALPVIVRRTQWLLSCAVDPVCSDVFFFVWELSWSDGHCFVLFIVVVVSV